MIGFLVGTACLFGLIATIRRGRCGQGYGYGGGWGGRCGGGWGGGGGCHSRGPGGGGWHHRDHEGGQDDGPGFGGGRGPGRWVMRMVSERLDATPAQEKVILEAITEVREAMREAKSKFKGSREDVAKAVRGEHFDAAHMGEVFGKHDVAIESVRKAFVGAVSKVHEVLDERQRKILADLVEHGGGFFRGGGGFRGGFGGPYRGGWA